MAKKEVVIKIGGEAGYGIKVSGLMVARTFFKKGYSVFGYSEYPSLVRGGHNTYQLNISKKDIVSPTKNIDLLVALNEETIEKHLLEINEGGVIVGEGKYEGDLKGVVYFDVPLLKIAKEIGDIKMKNSVALGAVCALVGLGLDELSEAVEHVFLDKGRKIVDMNKKAIQKGYDIVAKQDGFQQAQKNIEIEKTEGVERKKDDFVWTANEATAHGIIQAGCGFYAAYPMTPATSIMHILAEKQREYGFVLHQTEDEISAIGSAIGASVNGVRSATGTSGGGFALMNESLGMAGIMETPLIVINSQRTAPATGLPTWTEQGDMQFAIRASHGEFPRIVVAPGDADEAFELIQKSFNWADKFQVPIIFLLDKFLSESEFVSFGMQSKYLPIERDDIVTRNEIDRIKDYKRYEFSKNGISRRVEIGSEGGEHVINSDDHDEEGFSTEDSEARIKMMDKRFLKMKHVEAEIPEPNLIGDGKGDLVVVGWGSVKGPVIDAMSEFGDRVNFLHFNVLWPFKKDRVKSVLKNAKNVLLVENNKTAQLGDLIKQEVGIDIKNKFLKYDGRPFFREELVDKFQDILK